MKRLLAYLLLVLGLGLVVNVNAEARILEVCSDGINGYNGKLYIKNHFSKKSLNKQKTGLLGSQYYECESHSYSNNKKLYNAVYKGMGWHHSVNQGYKWNGIIYAENYLVILRSFDIKSNIYPSEKKQTQIAKVEPSQTQEVAKNVSLKNINFCEYKDGKGAYISKYSCDTDYSSITKNQFLEKKLYQKNIDNLNNIELHNNLVGLYKRFDNEGLNKKIIHNFINTNKELKKYIPIISSIKQTRIAKKKLEKKRNITIVDLTFCARNIKDSNFVVSGTQGYLGNEACPKSHPIVISAKRVNKEIDRSNICVKSLSTKKLILQITPTFMINTRKCNKKFDEFTVRYDGENFYVGEPTQIAKKEPTVKPKKTNKQSKTKITKKIIKTDAQDPKVKDISTWEKNVLAAIEKEKNDPYCKLVDKKPNLAELLTKKKSGADFKLNLCIKKSDVLKLGEYKKFNTPKFILDEMKGCKSNICIGNKSGKNVFKIFVQRTPVYHANHPGDMIKGMAWFEILYQTKLKKLQKTLRKYDEHKYEGLMKLKKKDHEKQIYSLIKLNNGRIKMRKALGFTLYHDMYDVIEGQWLLAEFLNKDKLKVSKVKMTPEMFKRKLLIEKYKTVLAKYKKKLDEEKDKKIN